ncbi:hypothetical protein BDN71DRAFT_1522050 [Pleurotus eryngii]|uniref:Uncharacterized protein n=1 Tax=Pleurotus eryngii TaxID=5323 RepID=A0A9P6DCQ4_PLEER|nr:hypothetical protein BDN71DRAFT_1522050 [Pleurotus eryngii]
MSSSSTNQGSTTAHFEARRMEVREILRVAEEKRQVLLKGLEDDERELKEMARDEKNSIQRAREELERDLADDREILSTLTVLLDASRTGGPSSSELERRISLVRRCADLAERVMNWELKDGGIKRRLEIQEAKIREERAKVEGYEGDFRMAARLFGLGDGEGSA